MDLFDALCRSSGIEAVVSVANTFRDWRSEIVNYAASAGASNGSLKACTISSRIR